MDGSSEYGIFETAGFLRIIGKLSKADARAIRAKLTKHVHPQLREQPFSGANIRKLRGFAADVWRYRIGRFRVFYTVEESQRVVSIVSVDDRKNACR